MERYLEMQIQCKYFQWSDNWWIEDNKAWFAGGDIPFIFELNMDTKNCKIIAELPVKKENMHRVNPYCIKYEDKIFCMPCRENNILIYHLFKEKFTKIDLSDFGAEDLVIAGFWKEKRYIYALVASIGKIIVIDAEKECVESCYSIGDIEEDTFFSGIRVEDNIYINSRNNSRIYEFDMLSKSIKRYELPMLREGIGTLSYDGSKFWLSGYRKELYIWEKESGEVQSITQLPSQFGIYNFGKKVGELVNYNEKKLDIPFFIYSVSGKKNTWFLPTRTNKILYVDNIDKEVSIYDIESEEETIDYLKRNAFFSYKYLLVYFRLNRYIGVYSMKNECYFEIDIEKKQVCDIKISIDYNDVKKIYQSISQLDENSKFHKYLFYCFLNNNENCLVRKDAISTGERIYQEIKNS